MSGLDASSNTLISVVIGVMSVVLILVYLLNQWRLRKRDALRHETTQALPERAYNQIRLARAGADHMGRQGYDVTAVHSSLAEADTALERGNHAVALRTAEGAREKLVAIREGRSSSPAAASPLRASTIPVASMVVAGGIPARKGSSGSAPAGAPAPSEEARPKLPTHQVEARFELALFREELAKPGKSSDPAARREAESLAAQAQSAYDGQRYTEAWQLALRGRRRLGSSIEHIGGKGRGVAPERPGAPSAPDAGTDREPEATRRCPQCGNAVRASDRFCRGCGTTLAADRCPRCGAAQEPSDRFCAVCGAPAGE